MKNLPLNMDYVFVPAFKNAVLDIEVKITKTLEHFLHTRVV